MFSATRITDHHQAFAAACELFHISDNPNHYNLSITELYRFVVPALRLNQFVCLADDGYPTFFAQWAWLSPVAADGFLNNTKLLKPEDFAKTSEADQLFVIDLIAPFGDAPQRVREFTYYLSEIAPSGLFVRHNPDGSVRRVGRINARVRPTVDK